MSTTMSQWRPSWWTEEIHGSACDRAQEAMRRDWSRIMRTLKQAAGQEHLATIDQADPLRVIGAWSDAEIPYRFGHAARRQFGAEHPRWSPELEAKLESEWTTPPDRIAHDWGSVRRFVRRGYELDAGPPSSS
jgi:hypothetical protein